VPPILTANTATAPVGTAPVVPPIRPVGETSALDSAPPVMPPDRQRETIADAASSIVPVEIGGSGELPAGVPPHLRPVGQRTSLWALALATVLHGVLLALFLRPAAELAGTDGEETATLVEFVAPEAVDTVDTAAATGAAAPARREPTESTNEPPPPIVAPTIETSPVPPAADPAVATEPPVVPEPPSDHRPPAEAADDTASAPPIDRPAPEPPSEPAVPTSSADAPPSSDPAASEAARDETPPRAPEPAAPASSETTEERSAAPSIPPAADTARSIETTPPPRPVPVAKPAPAPAERIVVPPRRTPPPAKPKRPSVAAGAAGTAEAGAAERRAGSRGNAGEAGAAAADALRSWRAEILAALARAKRYPEEARALGRTGRAVIAFTLHRDGRVDGVTLVTPSGVAALDRASLELPTRARLPAMPAGAGATQSFTAAVRYDLR
jgi:protein TonB